MARKTTKAKSAPKKATRKVRAVASAPVNPPPSVQPSEKQRLLALYETLKSLGIHSIGDLENMIARAE